MPNRDTRLGLSVTIQAFAVREIRDALADGWQPADAETIHAALDEIAHEFPEIEDVDGDLRAIARCARVGRIRVFDKRFMARDGRLRVALGEARSRPVITLCCRRSVQRKTSLSVELNEALLNKSA